MATPTLSEVESTVTRLVSHKNVRGVLILSRAHATILRFAGPLFATPSSTVVAAAAGETDGATVSNIPALARTYAKVADGIVKSLSEEVDVLAKAGDETAGLGFEREDGDEGGKDELKFLRVRTKRHDILISPDEKYVLVVVQDPTK